MEETMPRYVKIAHDICSRILNGEFKEIFYAYNR